MKKNNIFEKSLEWKDHLKNQLGLPRPYFKIDKEFIKSTSINVSRVIPVPWQSYPIFNKETKQAFRIIEDNELEVYAKNKCVYCGIAIDDIDLAIRWVGYEKIIDIKDKPGKDGPRIYSDFSPLHIECMKQTRIFCPFMKKLDESVFEYGYYKDLKNNAINYIKKYM